MWDNWPTKYPKTRSAEARLEDGQIVEYDLADPSPDCEFARGKFELIGKGVIHSINGIPQEGKRTLYFYKRLPA